MREADRFKLKNISGYSYQRELEEYEQFMDELRRELRMSWWQRVIRSVRRVCNLQ